MKGRESKADHNYDAWCFSIFLAAMGAYFLSLSYDAHSKYSTVDTALTYLNRGENQMAKVTLTSGIKGGRDLSGYFRNNGLDLTAVSIKPETLEEISSYLNRTRIAYGVSAASTMAGGLLFVALRQKRL